METGKPTTEKYMRVNNRDAEKVNKFKYQESIITNNNNITSDINHIINMANKFCCGLRNTMGLKLLRKDTKCKH
jgi:hypothetical protein